MFGVFIYGGSDELTSRQVLQYRQANKSFAFASLFIAFGWTTLEKRGAILPQTLILLNSERLSNFLILMSPQPTENKYDVVIFEKQGRM
jgi:hypothetical protein